MILRKKITTLFFLAVAALGFTSVSAQEKNEATLKNLLINKTFVFKAQSAWPLQGTVVQPTPGFDVKLLNDSVNTYLPYFGRAFQGGYSTSTNGIQFISTKFDYKLKEKEKGGWELIIKPNDAKEVTQLIYAISKNGYATLQVTSLNRQAISFYGIIEKSK